YTSLPGWDACSASATCRAGTQRLQFSLFHQRNHGGAGNNEMVEQADINQCQRPFQMLREVDVRLAGAGGARWMIVRKDDSAGMMLQACLDNFAGIDSGLGERAS